MGLCGGKHPLFHVTKLQKRGCMNNTIFVSYARENSEFALRLAHSLGERGIAVWIDQQRIEVGKRWPTVVEEALKQSNYFLIILSPSSVASREVLNELDYALKANKTILPVIYEECSEPYRIDSIQHVDFSKLAYQDGLNRLVQLFQEGQDLVLEPAGASGRRRHWLPIAAIGAIILFVLIGAFSSPSVRCSLFDQCPSPTPTPVIADLIDLLSQKNISLGSDTNMETNVLAELASENSSYRALSNSCLLLLGNRRFNDKLSLDMIQGKYSKLVYPERKGDTLPPDQYGDLPKLEQGMINAWNTIHPEQADSLDDITE